MSLAEGSKQGDPERGKKWDSIMNEGGPIKFKKGRIYYAGI